MLFKQVLPFVVISVLTSAVYSKVLELSPDNDKHVVERKYQPEQSAENQDELELDRSRRDANSDLIHTHTNLTGDSHKYAAIHWSGLKESNVIFILTYDKGTSSEISSSTLWRSSNYGASFQNQDSNFDSNATINSFSYSDTDITSIALSDVTNAVLYLTRDEGISYQRVKTQVGFSWVDYFPGSNMVLAGYDKVGQTLWGSVDSGSNWFKMRDGVSKYMFAYNDGNSHSMYVITTDKLLYTINIDPVTSKQPQLTDQELGFVSLSRLDKIGDYLFVEKQVEIQRNSFDVQLWVSFNRGAFRKAHFATTTYISQQVYHIISVHDRQLLVILTRYGNAFQGDLFLSDETGTFYTLSLQKIITIAFLPRTLSDVYVVSGMNGTLLANVIDGNNQVTMISYDSGGEWSKLPSVSTDCYLPLCSLNIVLSLTAYFNRLQTGIYSKSSAVGIILAHGTDGASVPIQSDQSGIGLYVSRDGGQTWTLSQSGTWLVTFADYAGVIAAVRDFRSLQVTEISYSFDEGANWNTYTFSQRQVTIGGFLTEPGEATLVDILFAYDQNNKNSEWEIVTVNYSNILSTPCLQDDYEDWSPYNARVGRDCLLGSSVTWQRKKPSSLCYNGPDFNRIIKAEVCQCSIDDYECDWGYKHPSLNSESCVLDAEQPFNRYAPECSEGAANFSYTRGFRKIAGDVCIGGDSGLYEPIVKSCGGGSPTGALSFSGDGLVNSYAEIWRDIRFNLIINSQISYSQYYWDFGDGHYVNSTGMSVNHTFTEVGKKMVSVHSPDIKYSYYESIQVVNPVQDVVFSHSYGVQVGANTVFNSFLLTESRHVVDSAENSPEYFGYVYFSVWYNSTNKTRLSDDLTHQFIFEHIFPFPGIFSMKITVAGPLNKVTKNIQIVVYEKVFVIELTFSQIFNISNPSSPETWLNQVKVVLIDLLNRLNIIPSSANPEVNIQPNSNIVYLSFNASNPLIDLNALLQTIQSSIDQGQVAISTTYYHASVTSVRDVTDLIGINVDDNSTAYVGAIVFLLLIILTLAFLLTLSVTVIVLMVRLCRQSRSTQTRQGPGNRVYMHLQGDDDAEMEPLAAESDDEHLLPAQPDAQTVTEPNTEERQDDVPLVES